MELMTPVSMALTSFGVNKFISGASHDLRFTIGQHGVDGKKSFYTRELPGEAADSGSVLSGTALVGNHVDIAGAVNEAASHGILAGTTATDAAGVTLPTRLSRRRRKRSSAWPSEALARPPITRNRLPRATVSRTRS